MSADPHWRGLDGPFLVFSLQEAILCAIAYSDVFHYPLTAAQVHRYLIGLAASRDAVLRALGQGEGSSWPLAQKAEYYCLCGSECDVQRRMAREGFATRLWPRAVRYGWAIGRIPFVRMVAVTGALAMNNVDPGDDIDYLVVTEPGRLWLCRLLIVSLVRAVARGGDVICPNYVLSERALYLEEHNLFSAHEVLQMVPILGWETYVQLRRLNSWTEQWLPNAHHQVVCVGVSSDYPRRLRALGEDLLRSRLVDPLERWEMQRKLLKFGQRGSEQLEARFSADRCKGHFGGYLHRTLDAYEQRLRWLHEQGALSSESLARMLATSVRSDRVADCHAG